MLANMQCHVVWNARYNTFVLSMFMIYGCDVCELVCYTVAGLGKINPWLLLRICGFFMSWSWSIDKNSVASNAIYCLSNLLGESREFWWLLLGINNGSLCSVGEYQKSIVTQLDFRLQNNLLENLEKLDGFHRELIVWSFSFAGDLNDVLWGLFRE